MRNLKILGLALVAVLAMAAVAASAASADDLTSESSPVTLAGTNEAGIPDAFTITAGNTTCKEVVYDATTTTPTTTVTATPTYPSKNKAGEQNCTSLGFPATIHTNGCDYKFSINAAAPTTQGTVKIECPTINGVKQEITVTAEAAGTVKCTIHVPEQTLAANSVTYSNIGAGTTREVTISVNVAPAPGSLTYTHTKGTGIGACTAGSATNGSFTGKGVVTGLNDVGGSGHVGIFLS